MKKRGIWLLLIIVFIINLTACKADEPETRTANAFVEKEMVRGPEIEKNDINLEEYLTKSYIDAMEDWQKAYREVLLSYESKSHLNFIPHFNLIYVDEDDIPELAIIDADRHLSSVLIYTYNGEKAVAIDEYGYGSYGIASYVPKENLIWNGWDSFGDVHDSYCKIENSTNLTLVSFTYYQDPSLDEQFFIDQEAVTSEKYLAELNSYEEGKEFFTVSYENSYEISKKNVDVVLAAASGNGDWKEAYEAFLLVHQEEFDSEHPVDSPRFNLAYIDEDEIPELAVMVGTAHVNGVDIYTYYRGEVVLVRRNYGSFGKFIYFPGENLIASHYMAQGDQTSTYHKIEKGKDIKMIEVESWSSYDPDDLEFHDHYSIEDKEVTKEAYEAQMELYEGGKEFVLLGYDDSYPIDEAVIQSVFDRER